MPDVTDLRPGDPETIAGYRVLSRLGAGGQGVVFLAAATSGDLVAIKQLRAGFGLDDTNRLAARAQFAKEVAAARRVAPFCTAQVVDAQLDGESPYVVSEFIAGPSLQQQIERNGPMQGTALQRMAIGTATALAAIHQAGVVHRDFKPANVMLSPEGPRVIDFGIARDLSTDTTVTSRVFGTPAYMSPEQVRADVVGPPTDMFAWASVMTYAATGRAPFDAPHMMAVMYRIGSAEPDLSGMPDELAAVLRQCLEKDPVDRPSAQQALAQLLGRPTPVRDQTDPTSVLAEATGLVRPRDTGSSGPVDAPPARPAPLPPAPSVPVISAPVISAPVISVPVPVDETVPAWGSPPPEPPGLDPAEPPVWGTAPDPASNPTRASNPTSVTGPTQATSAAPTWAGAPNGSDGSGSPGGSAWGAPPSPRRRRGARLPTIVVLAIILGGAAAFSGNLGFRSDRTLDPDRSELSGDPQWSAAIASAMASADIDGSDYSEQTSEPTAKSSTKGKPAVAPAPFAVPKAFAGVWRGPIASTGTVNGRSVVRLTLKSGSSSGRLRFTDLNCSGTVTVASVLPGVISLDAVITQDPKDRCSKRRTVYLTGRTGKQLQFTITGKDQPARAGSGTLTTDH